MPATPTSVRRAILLPRAHAVTNASSATGKSLVPAVTIITVPRPAGGDWAPRRFAVRPRALISTPRNRRGSDHASDRDGLELRLVAGHVFELLSISQVVAEDPLDFVERVHRVQLASDVGGARQSFHVPAQVLAELDRGAAWICLIGGRHLRVLACNAEARLDVRIG